MAAGQQTIPRQAPTATGALQGQFRTPAGLGIGGVTIYLRNLGTGADTVLTSTGDGIFRVPNLAPGRYSLRAELEGFQPLERGEIVLRAGEVFALEAVLEPKPSLPRLIPDAPTGPPYGSLPKPPEEQPETPVAALPLLPEERVFQTVPNRWKFDWPDYHRYGPNDEVPYIKGRLLDPYNRNKLKGDYPIFGNQTFLAINLTSDTFNTPKRLPITSNQGSERSDSTDFFGRLGQYALSQTFGFSFDLYRGDTSFRPIDWRIKVTPELNINYLKVQENGIVSPDVRAGSARLDAHLGLQEAFVEARLKTLSNTFDFVSARAGIQTFNSDFRGFVFFDQEPGLRIFGNYKANRYQYNAAYFAMLEKDTNSGLNSMNYRNQQVMIANLYRQDFIRPGYNIQVSFHYDKDEATVQFDTNNFLVRPTPVGVVKPHAIRSYYYGLTGDGHIGRLNITHAFYQVLGHDALNPIAAKRLDINAQMAAVELSMDKDWLRFKTSVFWTSGDKDPRDGTARGFDAILDNSNFAGGFFSFWNREGIRLTGTGAALVQPGSLIPSLRSSKSQGQASYVNPGIFILNGGTTIEFTPKLRGIVNFNAIRFHHPEALELLLFQKPIHAGVGADAGLGVSYRPALSENMTITAAFNTFTPFQGFRDIYFGKTLYSIAANVRFRF